MAEHVSFWQHVGNFFYSNLFVGLVALIVGVAAYRVYYKQKRDEKRNAANILILEIQSAEDGLTRLTLEKPILEISDADVFLMRVASWDNYKHLFVKDFKDINEFNKITDFYNKCKEYDDAVRLRNASFFHNQKVLRANTHAALRKCLEDYVKVIDGEEDQAILDELYKKYLVKRQLILDMLVTGNKGPGIFTYIPNQPDLAAKRVLGSIDRNLSTSTPGEVLKVVAKSKGFITVFGRLSL